MVAIQHSTVLAPIDPADIVVRPAHEDDVAGMAELVAENVRAGHLLPRSADEIHASLANWVVACHGQRVIGIGSLLLMNPDLVEVRSLAVATEYRAAGVGAKIVLELVAQAKLRQIHTVFALTRAVSFFVRLGFTITDKERFPEKVWRDCVKCPLVTCCDETAVVWEH
ncbi:GNAT family N-acetyltransferase [Herpetosiphon geysericola]|uniref:Acetyltransferase n=1 Tax=Herpetosiphon geysericola TaxID=70996 RepID=A0A0P6Y2B1_9CHLR|nr:GNAT family N-acetyltransferase [Herpetosiphon geysericola]KPL86760.1 acetyltransferase [Herpetosiphon geysericola]